MPSTAQWHLGTSHTFNILLHQFKTGRVTRSKFVCASSKLDDSFAPVQNRTSCTFKIRLHQFKTGRVAHSKFACGASSEQDDSFHQFKTGRVAHSKFVCASSKQDDSFAPVQNRTSRTFKIRLRRQFKKGRFFCTTEFKTHHKSNARLQFWPRRGSLRGRIASNQRLTIFPPLSRKKYCGKACDDISCSQPAIRCVFQAKTLRLCLQTSA